NGPDIEYGNNPVVITTSQTGYNNKINYSLQSKMSLNINIPWVEGLSLSLNYSYDKYYNSQKEWETPWYLYNWDRKTYDDAGQPILVKGKKGFSSAELEQKTGDSSNNLFNTLVNYKTSFKDHNFKFLLGAERIWGTGFDFSAFRKYYVSTALDELFAGGDAEKDNDGDSYEKKRMNYFGRINYDYKSKYLLEFLWRVDGSYIFPESKRFGFFPGISTGWRLSEEDFWKENVPLINYFKLRASWGQTGNDRIIPYQYLSSYGFVSTSYVLNSNVQKKSLEEKRIPNPEVTWEVANQSNIGFDGEMLDHHLSFSLEYFYNLRTNILWNRNASVPASTGLTLPKENIGKVSNRGIEFQLGYQDKINDFNYSVSVNGGFNKNKIDFWDETPGIPEYQQSTGHPMPTDPENNVLYYNAIGIFKDQAAVDAYPHWANARAGDVIFEDVNDDGAINGLDRIRIDKTNIPTFMGGLNIDLQYKDFYANIFFQGATGAQRYDYYEMQGDAGNYLKRDYVGRWTEDNPNATQPRTWNRYSEYWRNQKNTYWLQNTDYLRLKTLEIGYNFKQEWLKNIGIKNLRLYVSGMNLFTITGIKDFDPESDSATSYPLNKVYNIGANLTF
ncbi:MAG: SusC/RagA family TonB-linked outer membrane protein, partial [Massilibacteroides sp.]|nr:SusC/RagA family TonB-linked outer membrane protein [Massilibacteroides sp.]